MRVRFGEFTFDDGTRQLMRGETALHLSPKAFQLLALLLASRPSVVDRTALRQQLWPDTHVVEAALGNLMAEIRATLGDAGSGVVRTVHGVGYAFSGDADDLDDATRPKPPEPPRYWVVWNHRAIVLDSSSCVVGRDPGCAIWIDAPGVSRRHARIDISPHNGVPSIEDLDSTNGTYVGGKRVTRPKTVVDGDQITLGEATLTFRVWRDVDTATKRVRPPRS